MIRQTKQPLSREKISEFIGTIEGRRAFEDIQRDIITLFPGIGYLENDVTNSTNTFIDTELRVAVEEGKVYTLEAVLTFQSAALNNGIGVAFRLPTNVDISFQWIHNHTFKEFEGGYNVSSGTVSSDTNAVPVINSNIPLTGFGILKANNSGDVFLQFRSEGAAQITLKGGMCVLRLNQVV